MASTAEDTGKGKASGVAMLVLVKTLRIYRDEARRVLPERLRHYLRTNVEPDLSYPEEDHVALLDVLAHIVPSVAGEDVWRSFGRRQAAIDLRELFPAEVRHGDPWATLERLDHLWRLYHDTGRTVVERRGERQAAIAVHGYAFLSEGFCRLLAGYYAETLRLAGARGVDVRVVEAGTAEKPGRWLAEWC